MSSNPYDPPQSTGAVFHRHLPRSLGPVTLWITIVFSLEAVSLLSMSVSQMLLTQRAGGAEPSPDDAGATLLTFVIGLSALGLMALYFTGVVLFCVWVYRANINADALVSNGLESTPGWAVGWFFVPIANLFKPYQVVTEIYRASDPHADPDYWSIASVPAYIPLWWLTYLGFNLTANVGFGGMLSGALGVVAMVMVIVVTRSIRRLQEEKARLAPAGAAPVVVRPASNPLLG